MKITKEEFADKIIGFIHELDCCPIRLGLPQFKTCATDLEEGYLCEDCWKQAVEQGVER